MDDAGEVPSLTAETAVPMPCRAIVSSDAVRALPAGAEWVAVPVALLITSNMPVATPIEVGRNMIESVIEAPGAIVIADRCDVKTVFVVVVIAIINASLPVLEKVMSVHNGLPTCVVPQSTLSEIVARIAPVRIPIPLMAIVSGDVIALLTTIKLPVAVPAAIGRNMIESMIEAPGAITSLERCDVKKAFVQVAVAIRNVSVPVFVSVISAEDVFPTCVVPQFTMREVIARIAVLSPDTVSLP